MSASPTRPRIAALLGVKDEVELIDAAVLHLERSGIEEIVVQDNGSTDGTLDRLQAMQAAGRLRLCCVDDRTLGAEDDLALALSLIRGVQADWVTVLDADEFLLGATPDLRDCPDLADPDIDCLTLPRRNVVLAEAGLAMRLPPSFQALQDILLVAEPHRDYWQRPALQRELPWILSAIMPRFLARPSAIGRVTDGLHDVRAHDGGLGRRRRARGLCVAHVPFTGYGRFLAKVRNIDRWMSAQPHAFDGQAMHWKRWRQALQGWRLPAEFDAQRLSAGALAALRREGRVRSAADFLAQLGSDPDLAV